MRRLPLPPAPAGRGLALALLLSTTAWLATGTPALADRARSARAAAPRTPPPLVLDPAETRRPQPPETTLPAPVRQALAEVGIPDESLAVRAFPLDDPASGLVWQAERPMVPGSVIKLLTAAVALDRLGSELRPRTELLAEAPVLQGALDGPLYLRGAGDGDFDTAALWSLLRQLRLSGVQTLAQGVVLDRSLFSPARPDLGAPPFDETPNFAYNVVPDALLLDGGVQQLELRSAGAGTLQARLPDWPQVEVDTHGVTLAEAPCRHWDVLPLTFRFLPPPATGPATPPRLILEGRFPVSCEQKPWLQALDRQWVLAFTLRQLWQSLGGELRGEIRDGVAPPAARVLQSHAGRPLAESLRGALKRSDNLQLRLLYQRLGAAAPEATLTASTQERAATATQAWLAQNGLDSAGLVLDNGAGLSRTERISADALARLVRHMVRSPRAPEWLSGLPVAGVDGTLRRRFVGAPAQGRARLKTGTLRDVVSLAGVVQDGRGRTWVLAVMLNDEAAGWAGRPVLDQLVNWLASRR